MKKPCAQGVQEPTEVLKTRITCRFLEPGRNEQRITTKVFCEPTGTVSGMQMRKGNVVESVKNLSQDEPRQMEQAKQNEM